MPEVKYQSYRYEPITRQKTSKIEHYERILIPKYKAGKRKILFVLDFVPTEDLRSGMLLSGETGDLLHNLVDLAKERFLLKECDDFSWVACSFNMYRTLGKSSEYMAEARQLFAERIAYIINDYKPDVVISFGKYSTIPLIQDKMKLSGGKFNNWIGVPIKETIEHEDSKHTCLIVPTLSLNTILTGGSIQSYMIGYIARNIANALNEGLIYKIDAKAASKHKTVLIDDVEKFDDMLDMLAEQKVVAIDTETENLNRVTNKLLTIQFAKCTKYAYILPIYHKDAVFTGKETRYIVDRLGKYFEGDNDNDYHVYANAQFDLNIIRTTTKARYMHNRAWCIFAGEFCFHPETLVETELGKIRILDLVYMEVKPLVWSFNFGTRLPELKEIEFTSEHTTEDEMYEIEYEGGTVRLTGKHKIWSESRNSYIRVDEIYEGENVLILE